jgi:methylated-DNA-[protein]-cysteine S-methyltransferase
MGAIVKSAGVRAELRRYAVPGWGLGELWTRAGVILAHEFEWRPSADEVEDEVEASSQDAELVRRVLAFFRGEAVTFEDVPLDLDDHTPFQRAVADALRAVPRGETVTYGELAALAGHPGAQRAVGSYCACNRFMLFVPCHRVVAADGLGPYGSAGPAVKRRLLALEGVSL